MTILNPQRLPGVCFIFLVVAISATTFAGASNEWRVQFSESARSDGVITFEFSPRESAAFRIDIGIDDGTRESQVARTVAATLSERLPGDDYAVEVDDGEDVLIKKRLGAEPFGLRLLSNTVKSVRVDLDRE